MEKAFSPFFIETADQETRYLFCQPLVTIGRCRKNDLILEDADVSRNNATISFIDNQFILENRSLTNRIIVNGHKLLPKDSFPLSSGDEFSIGRRLFIFREAEHHTPLFRLEISKMGHLLGVFRPKTLPAVIGRYAKDSDIVLNNPCVSSTHTKILLKNGQFMIEDMNSTNGTYINNVALKRGESFVIRQGDEFQLSDFKVKFFEEISAQENMETRFYCGPKQTQSRSRPAAFRLNWASVLTISLILIASFYFI